MIDMQHLRAEAIRLGAIDRAAAQLLNAAGDEIQRLRVQLAVLLPAIVPARAAAEATHGL